MKIRKKLKPPTERGGEPMIKIIENLKMALCCNNNATKTDWILGIVSITPILPWFIFVPRLVGKLNITFNGTWFKLYNKRKHNSHLKELYNIEII